MKVPISQRALVQRVSRRLQKDGRSLRKVRGRAAERFGYVVVDSKGIVSRYEGMGLEDLARDLGVLEAWESVDAAA